MFKQSTNKLNTNTFNRKIKTYKGKSVMVKTFKSIFLFFISFYASCKALWISFARDAMILYKPTEMIRAGSASSPRHQTTHFLWFDFTWWVLCNHENCHQPFPWQKSQRESGRRHSGWDPVGNTEDSGCWCHCSGLLAPCWLIMWLLLQG